MYDHLDIRGGAGAILWIVRRVCKQGPLEAVTMRESEEKAEGTRTTGQPPRPSVLGWFDFTLARDIIKSIKSTSYTARS